MPEQYTEITKRSLSSRLGGSFGGIFFGIILFFVSFVLLFWNEGRVGLFDTAKNAIPFDATALQQNAPEGELVAASGMIISDDLIGDGQFLKNGRYLNVRRNVEMYAWVETSKSKTDTKIGGSQETITTYDYDKKWTGSVANSSNFKVPEGHINPPKRYDDIANTSPTARVGVYGVDLSRLKMPVSQILQLTADDVILPAEGELVQGKYIYIGGSSIDDPVIGDIRISYSAVLSGQDVTVFGRLVGDKIKPFTDKDGQILYEARVTGFEESVVVMKKEHSMSLWFLRFLGFFMMWIGLKMVIAPLSVLLDILPILGSVSRGAVGLITGLLSLVLSIVTILVSMLLHNMYAVIVAVVIVGCILGYMLKKKYKS